MRKWAERIGIATVAGAVGYFASDLGKTPQVPTTPEDGTWQTIPAQIDNIRFKIQLNNQDVEVKIDGQPMYRCLPTSPPTDGQR